MSTTSINNNDSSSTSAMPTTSINNNDSSSTSTMPTKAINNNDSSSTSAMPITTTTNNNVLSTIGKKRTFHQMMAPETIETDSKLSSIESNNHNNHNNMLSSILFLMKFVIYMKSFIYSSAEKARSQSEIKSFNTDRIIPLAHIAQYTPVGFVVKGVVTHKSEINEITINGNKKTTFWIALIDENETEIKVVFWSTEALRAFVNIKKRHSYYMTGLAPRKVRNRRYQTHGPIVLHSTVGLRWQEDDEDDDLLRQTWNFPQNILKIQNKREGSKLDVIGFAYNVHETRYINTRAGQKKLLLKFELVDETARIAVSVWGDEAKKQIREGQLLALKSVNVSSYSGRSLILNGYIDFDIQNTRADKLKAWQQTKNPMVKSLFAEIKNLSDGNSREYDWKSCARISIKNARQMIERFRRLNKKPTVQAFRLIGRIEETSEKFCYSKNERHEWCLKLDINDEEGNWLSIVAFQKVANKLLGKMTATEAVNMQQNETAKFCQLMDGIKYANSKKEHEFCIYWKINDWNEESKYLDFIAEDIMN